MTNEPTTPKTKKPRKPALSPAAKELDAFIKSIRPVDVMGGARAVTVKRVKETVVFENTKVGWRFAFELAPDGVVAEDRRSADVLYIDKFVRRCLVVNVRGGKQGKARFRRERNFLVAESAGAEDNWQYVFRPAAPDDDGGDEQKDG